MKCPNPDCKGELKRVPTLTGYFVQVFYQKDHRRYDLLECPDCGLTVLQRKR